MVAASFSAYAAGSKAYQPDETVLFEGIISNYGNYYDPVTSIFTCPVHGFYMLGVDFWGSYGEEMCIQIMKDDQVLIIAESDDDDAAYQHAGATVIVECEQGGTLYIKSPYYGLMYAYDGDSVSHFYGFLVHNA